MFFQVCRVDVSSIYATVILFVLSIKAIIRNNNNVGDILLKNRERQSRSLSGKEIVVHILPRIVQSLEEDIRGEEN